MRASIVVGLSRVSVILEAGSTLMGPSGYTLEITLNLVHNFFFFSHVYVAVQSCPSVKFYFLLFWV